MDPLQSGAFFSVKDAAVFKSPLPRFAKKLDAADVSSFFSPSNGQENGRGSQVNAESGAAVSPFEMKKRPSLYVFSFSPVSSLSLSSCLSIPLFPAHHN